jgi:GDP-mannose 6-dehydrogenase
MRVMRVSVFGLGYVGSVTAARLAADGHHVVGCDVDAGKVAAIAAGKPPLSETGLDELVRKGHESGRLRATTSAEEAVAHSDICLVCVGTPTAAGGQPDLGPLWRVGRDLGAALKKRHAPFAVVLRSTVLPGTVEGVLARAIEVGAGGEAKNVTYAYNPEFMREGTALRDFASPPFTIIGTADAETALALRALYAGVDAPIVETQVRVAEMLKYVCNSFHALKVAFTNEIAALCAALDVDADEVLRIFRSDHKLNVSEAYMRPGFAFGGSCLPKDVRALGYVAQRTAVDAPLIESIIPSNEHQLQRGVRAVAASGKKKIGLVGLSFKPGTDDVRESPLVKLVVELKTLGCDVRVYDRIIQTTTLVGANRRYLEEQIPDIDRILCSTLEALAEHSDIVVLGHTHADAEAVVKRVRPECLVVDLAHGSTEQQTAAVVLEHPRSRPPARLGLVRAALGSLFVLVGGLTCTCAAPTPNVDTAAELGVAKTVKARSERLPATPKQSDGALPAEPERIVPVPPGADLQAALDAAEPHDTLVLYAGTTYEGSFTLPYKDGDGWITIRGVNDVAPGRTSPERAQSMPKLVGADGAVITAAPWAHHYRFVGIEVKPAAGVFLHELVTLGQSDFADEEVPHHFVFDRCYIHGDPRVGARRGIGLNSAHTKVVGSWLSDFKEEGADSQAIAGWAGPGPFLLENDYLEGAGENVLFGGMDPPNRDRIPSDIEVRGNHFKKPLAWKSGEKEWDGSHWSVKNIFELKNARRVLCEQNLFENNWPDGQNGFAILFTVRNQEGNAPWSAVEDVTFRNNVVRRSASAVNILGHDNSRDTVTGQTRRIHVADNLFYEIGGSRWGGDGTLFQLLEGTSDVVIEHNTAFHTGNVIQADGAPHTRFVFRDNVVKHNEYGITGNGAGTGNGAIAAFFPGAVIRRNVIAGGDAAEYPPDNFFPKSLDGLVQLDPQEGVARLVAKSHLPGQATDGRDVGANPEALRAALGASHD